MTTDATGSINSQARGARPAPNNYRLELLAWWLPLLILVAIGAWLRLFALGHDLPSDADNDELYYFFWASDVRATGFPQTHNGSGYPPGFLYLYAAEQPIIEWVRGPLLDRSIEYFLYVRAVNALFGTACIVLMALLVRQISRSRLAGLLGAAFVALHGLMVQESRLAAPNAPWLFFTLLAFLCLFRALPAGRGRWLYLALLAGAVSFLFKYQTGLFLGLPFLYGLVLWRRGRLAARHFVVWLIGLSALFLWLIFVYHITNIVHTPETDTASALRSGGLVGLQSWYGNWLLIAAQLGGPWPVWIAAATCGWAAWALAAKRPETTFAGLDVLALGLFCVSFYGLMALFQITAPSKWLTFLVAVIAIAMTGLCALAAQIGPALFPRARRWSRTTGAVLGAAILWVFGLGYGLSQLQYWQYVYADSWTRPYAVNALNTWFAGNVPQGGRALVKANKILNTYLYAPQPLHSDTVANIFDRTIAEYREQGYDYLIWNDLGSNASSNLDYLNAHRPDLEAQGAREVLRLSNDGYWGPTIIVFQLPALPQHPLYAWFSRAISFRGYDLNGDTFRPGDELRLMLYWESAQVVQANDIVFVHLIDPKTGKLIAGQDGPPDYGNTPTWKWLGDMQLIRDQRSLTIPAGTKPGDYTLSIGMYDADSQQRVSVLDLQDHPIGDSLDLQTLHVQP
jgi:4-amino-4-deoxy-L-arabinose transferase-like glycosyltransferase